MPEARVIEVSEPLIRHTPELCIEGAGMKIPCRPGQHLALRYAVDDPHTHNVFDYVPESLAPRIFNIRDFARILVLDKWAGNCDGRQAVFVRRVNYRYYHVTFIDQGFYFNADEWAFPDRVLNGIYCRNYVYQHVRGWKDFEPALSRAEGITREQLAELAEGIPIEWWAKQSTRELRWLLAQFFQRRFMIRDLITQFRQHERNPFPNWQDKPLVSVPALPTDSGECRA